ncbi:MAG: acetyl-CoA carboxylase biotin carboxylase subunit [Cyclobacteriaceae bacterium]
MNKISKVLVANRGEIALRIFKSLKESAVSTVAVYSDADATAAHVSYADQAVYLGPAPAGQSYLRSDKIIEAATQTGADAIHPGYGFLSENHNFAKAVREAGLIFIGPSEHSIKTMGSKLEAKQAARAFGVPLVPGTASPVSNTAEAIQLAAEIGFPVLIKASAGGGGKGMRIVEREPEFEALLERAKSEALASFGDDSVFIEKYVSSPRHIEFQILGDQHGNIVHLYERECSIQRRHQKVIEEAPSCILTPELREKMGKAAVDAARSCGYFNAGTVEFILDENLNFYFLEMNTRLQVEHPVTEMITGLDLVKLQLHVAEGHPLPFRQEDLNFRGHAIEARIYAEDPLRQFMPDPGHLRTYELPSGHGVRVDNGYRAGSDVPVFYDPMLAKLICHAESRELAIEKMIRALDDYKVSGVSTTISFCRFAVNHPAFRSGVFDTHFVARYFTPELLQSGNTPEQIQKIAVAIAALNKQHAESGKKTDRGSVSLWQKNRLHGRD